MEYVAFFKLDNDDKYRKKIEKLIVLENNSKDKEIMNKKISEFFVNKSNE